MTNQIIFNMSIEEIKNLIDSNINVNINNKIDRGEVFTPFFIIKDMLLLLPKEVWSNPELKWLEPGSGFGAFSIVVFHKLMEGLEKWEPNKTKRKKHILQNMIYMIEISQINIDKCKKFLGNNINISKADFLKEENKWIHDFNGVSSFDIILGNPPFNQGGMRGKGRKDNGLKAIWPDFIKISLKLLNKNGYLLFFTPNSWTELKSSVGRQMIEKQLLYYRNYDVFIAYKIFDKKAGSMPLCYYLIKNTPTKNNTLIYDKIVDDYISYNVYDYYVIPTMNIELIKKVLKMTRSLGNLSEYFYFTPPKVKSDKEIHSDTFSEKYCYPLINYTHKKIYITYSCEKSKFHNGKPKLIFPNYSMGYPILDKEGILDVGGRASYVIYFANDDNNNNNIVKLKMLQQFLLTELVFAIINSLKTAQKFLSTRTFDILPNVSNLKKQIDFLDDNKLYKLFKLTQKQIEGINFQINKGEGNLTGELKKQILDFELKDNVNKETYDYIKNNIKNSKNNNIIIKRKGKRNNVNT